MHWITSLTDNFFTGIGMQWIKHEFQNCSWDCHEQEVPYVWCFLQKYFVNGFFILFRKKPVFSKTNCSGKKIIPSSSSGVVVITTAQRSSIKSELRFCAGSNPALGVSEICNGENLWQWSRLQIRRKRLSSVNHSAKTIHHHNP